MNNNIVSIFSIYNRDGELITSGLNIQQALDIKTHLSCIIKFTRFSVLSAISHKTVLNS